MTPTTRERPILFSAPMIRCLFAGTKSQTRRVMKPQPTAGKILPTPAGAPYRIGDTLWVREAWGPRNDTSIYYRADEHLRHFAIDPPPELAVIWENRQPPSTARQWIPSIHMPRWAARIFLSVTDVRVQRVQDITWRDVRAEGVDCPEHDFGIGMCVGHCPAIINAFRMLWNKLNAARGHSWESNPWVWAYTFERLKGTP